MEQKSNACCKVPFFVKVRRNTDKQGQTVHKQPWRQKGNIKQNKVKGN